MNIIRNLKDCGNFNTELLNLVNSLSLDKDIFLYGSEHGLRHPAGIYSVSSLRVFSAFEEFISSYKNGASLEDIDQKHKELLDSMMAFIDDCYHIMKCFYPISSVNKKIIYANKWLEKINEKLIKDFQKDIEPFRKQLALIVNKIKHNHARYCKVEVLTMSRKIKGYYIEGVDLNGVITPNMDIHPKWNNMYTAISYNKDIKLLLIYFYCIASIVVKTINKIIYSIYNRYLSIKSCNDNSHEKVFKVIQEVNSLDNLFFIDEYSYEIPQILIKYDEIEFRTKAYKTFENKLVRYSDFKIHAIMNGDGSSKSWASPYF